MSAQPPPPAAARPSASRGVVAALASATASGLIPIFVKQAYELGTAPFAVVMLRTVGAAGVLWVLYLLFARRHLYIYPFALASCLLAGVVNGLGSLLFYTSLQHLNASIGQLLFNLYLLFLTLFAWLDGHPLSPLTLLRVGLALVAVFLLKWTNPTDADWIAAAMMIGAGALYAAHIFINQHTLVDVPAPTVTLYSLTGMATTVLIAYLVGGRPALPATAAAWQPVLLLTAVTVASRLSLFIGMKHLGGLQTILLNLSEAFVTILVASVVLGEVFTPTQWLGAAILALSLLLITREKNIASTPYSRPWLLLFTAWFETLTAMRARKTSADAPPPPVRDNAPPR